MNEKTGGPALPATEEHGCNSGCAGMTLRDYFAAKALQGFLSGFVHTNKTSINPEMQDAIAGGMYSMADAMLKARGQA